MQEVCEYLLNEVTIFSYVCMYYVIATVRGADWRTILLQMRQEV